MIQIYFDGGANYITARTDPSNVLIRCDFSYTDCGETESLDAFIARHGGTDSTVEYLKDAYSAAVRL
jgi:hypothetical protein